MKTKIYPLLFAAALSFSACTEVLEPNVDYGGNTYINDYSALVDAVNNLNKSLQERFDALNQLLKAGMADIKLAIDENTGAIKIVDQNTQQGLKDINTSLFNGFKTLSDQIDAQGKSIVYAMNENGEILRLEIEKNGKLISSQLLESTNALVSAINDQTKSLEERFAALDATLKAGLKDVKVSIDTNTKAITLLDENTQGSLAKIDGTLTAGFKMIKEEISDTGEKIITAMNENGELLRITLNKEQEALSATIVGQTTRLIEAINNQTNTLEERFKALQEVIDAGLKEVYLSIDKNTGAITLLDKNVNANLVKIDGTLTEGFKGTKEAITDQGTKLVGAINKNGELLVAEIKTNGEVISAEIKNSVDDLIMVLGQNNKSLMEKLDALNTTVATGLNDVKLSVDGVTGQLRIETKAITDLDASLSSKLGTLETAVNGVATEVKNGFATINETMGDNNTKIIEAINKNGEVLRAVIDEQGKLITIALTDYANATKEQLAAIVEATTKLQTTLDELNGKMEQLTEAEKADAANIKKILATLNGKLAEQGIYRYNSRLYMTPVAWELVVSDKDADLYKSLKKEARTVTTKITYSTTSNYTKTEVNTAAAADLYAVNKQKVSGIGTSDEVFEIVMVDKVSTKVTLTGNKKWITHYDVGYSFADALSTHKQDASSSTAEFTVTYLNGNKLVEAVSVTVTTK